MIAAPGHGVLLVEVKGGAIEQRDGHWLQNGQRLNPMPLDQAKGFRRTLLNALRDRGVSQPPWIAAAVAFVDTPFSVGPTQSDLSGAVLGQQDLPYLSEALTEMAARLLAGKRAPTGSAWERAISELHALWGATWTPSLSLGDRIKLRDAELLPLDADQLSVLDALDENTRVLVRGGPGTGKTLLARDVCRRLAERGKSPLLLCSTRALATALRAGGLDAAFTVRAHAADLLVAAGHDVAGGAPMAEWSAEIWDAVPQQAAGHAELLEAARARWDAIVVDEGQDLSQSDWEFVRALAEGRTLWGFVDEGQGFWTERRCPTELFTSTYKLLARYRCPDALAKFADRYREGATADAGAGEGDTALGDELRVVTVKSESELEGAVAAELRSALSRGAAPRDIAVLSLAGQTRTALCARDRIGDVPVVRADDPSAPDALIADTFLRFKGLERPWIVITELGRGTTRYDVRMHVALTRATVGVVVVATEEAMAGDGRLRATVTR